MTITNADTRTLIGAVSVIHRPASFYLDRYFSQIMEFETETLDFDVISGGRTIAPYVHPDLPAKHVRTGGFKTHSFRPPYIKLLESVKPGQALRRRAGEAYNGEMSPGDRLDALTLDALVEQRRAILRRKEAMAVEAIDTGSIVCEGEEYARKVVDFDRDPSLSQALSGAGRWGEAGVRPLKSIKDTATAIQKLTGVLSTDVIFDPLAGEIFQQDDEVKELLDIRRQASGQIELGPVVPISDAQPIGSIGVFNFFIYQDYYTKVDGTDGQLLPDYTTHICSPAIDGVQAQGAIQDADLGLVSAEIAHTAWNEKNPSARQAMSQSAPLPVPTRINQSARIRVR